MPGAKTKSRKPPAKKSAKAVKTRLKMPAQGVKGTKERDTKQNDPLAPERVQDILNRLDQRYHGAVCALTHKSAWELLVATILSAQCTDVRVNMVTPILFQKYPTPQAFAALSPEQLEPDIRST